MIKGLGIDIVETARIRQVIERHGEQFLNRVYTPAEQAIGKIRASAHHFYAGRWAAKEAAAKALGCGIGSECSFNEIEVVDSPIGVPSLVFSGSAARTAAALGAKNVRVSITHEREYAAAVVIIEE
ncbi:MAG: holo-ACP synthase [Lentisphaeria bacterium]|nr:holo-ACP synthase [Lentisphaeria bacterium]